MEGHELRAISLVGSKTSDGQSRGDREEVQTGPRRIFTFQQIACFMLSYMASWEAISANVGIQMINGGPRAMFWGLLAILPGVACQAASMAEMASILPIAGAQYHWTWLLGPPKYRWYITWMQGWITWFGWIAILAAAVNLLANITTTLASAAHPGYSVQGWHTVLLMWGYLIVLGLLNTFGFRLVPYLELVSGVIHLILWIVVLVVLVCLGPRHTSMFAFFADTTSSGWSVGFTSFNIGAAFLAWGFVAFDSAAHISEDTKEATYTVPRSLFWTLAANFVLTLAMVAVVLLRLGDVEDVMTAIYPLLVVLQSATGSVGTASILIGGFAWINISSCAGSVASTSRLTWAWARDGALPRCFAQVDPDLRIPVRSVWLPILMVMVLSLLNLANSAAFAVIISLSSFGLYLSYGVAIGCMLSARLTRRAPFAPWSLGRWGPPVNAFAILHSAYFGVFMVLPTSLPITLANMNYALPITLLVLIGGTVSWFCWAKHNWPGLDDRIIAKIMTTTQPDGWNP